MINFQKYKTILFDCDGVILDSNKIKSEAFFEVVKKYGEENALKLVEYNKENGGISRFEKINYFFQEILKVHVDSEVLQETVSSFGEIVKEKLLKSNLTDGFQEFIENLPQDTIKIVVSGGLETELKEIFFYKGLVKYFDGIYGSPIAKNLIVENLIMNNQIEPSFLLIGDSRIDYEVAKRYDMDFLFISKYTEFNDWENYFEGKKIFTIPNFEVINSKKEINIH